MQDVAAALLRTGAAINAIKPRSVAAKVFCKIFTLIPHSDFLPGSLWEPGLFVCSEVQKGGSEANAEWRLGMRTTTGQGPRMSTATITLESCDVSVLRSRRDNRAGIQVR